MLCESPDVECASLLLSAFRMGGFLLQIPGNLKDWDVAPILHQIECPTLLLHSPTDEVHEIAVAQFFKRIPKIKWVEFYHSSHLAQFEEPERSVGPDLCLLSRPLI